MRVSFGARLGVFAVAVVILWLIGNAVFFEILGRGPAPLAYHLHLLIVVVCAVSIVSYVAQTRGTFDYRVRQALFSTILVFGTYAFFILAGRLFFSRTILTAAVPLTLMSAIAVVWIRHRYMGTRVAVIAPLIAATSDGLPAGTIITDPNEDLRRFDLALVSLDEPVSAEWAQALSRAMLAGCKIRHVGEHVESQHGLVALEHFELNHLPPDDFGSYGDFKRWLELGLVIFFAPIAVSILLAGMLAVLIGSGRPVFFVQDRTGLGGVPFRMWKLRTMHTVMTNNDHRAAVQGDARITKVGGILRRLRIDELPQLWNVLKGDMSLIGPRPEAVALHEAYVAHYPQFAFRCLVRPGITGWAQVNAPPSASPDEARTKLLYDLYYVKNRSAFLDAKIIVRTFWTLAHGSGVR